jgi:hypothetical protein
VSQGALVNTSILLAVPGIMVFLSLVLPPKVNRWLNTFQRVLYSCHALYHAGSLVVLHTLGHYRDCN